MQKACREEANAGIAAIRSIQLPVSSRVIEIYNINIGLQGKLRYGDVFAGRQWWVVAFSLNAQHAPVWCALCFFAQSYLRTVVA